MAFVEGRRAAEDDEHTEVCQLFIQDHYANAIS